MQPVVSMSIWVSLSNEQRTRIRSTFNIPRSSHVVVNDGRIETDGTTHEDFKQLTIEKMQKFLDDESADFYKLFDKVVARVTEDLLKPISVDINEPVTIIIEPKNKVRTKKHA